MREQKQKYRIRNWREYNTALVERGSLTVWFEEDHIKQWYVQEKTGRRGASNTYLARANEKCVSMAWASVVLGASRRWRWMPKTAKSSPRN